MKKKEECPAWGNNCTQCKKTNHFAVMCRNSSGSKHNVHMVEDLYDSESEDNNYVLTLEERNHPRSQNHAVHKENLCTYGVE